jgi:YfiH family protein
LANVATMDALRHQPQPDKTEPLTAAPLAALDGIRHAFFTRQGGVSGGLFASLNTGLGSADDRDRVLENRARAAAWLGVAADRLATPYQVHSAEAVILGDVWQPGKGPKADAVVTDRPGIAIGVGTADCGPVLFADWQARIIAAAHAGWQGALSGILDATLDAMENLGADRTATIAVLGPTISGAAYEVGAEFVARFTAADPDNDRFFATASRDGHARFDLPAYIIARLTAAGIGAAHDLGHCTYADEARCFSYGRATHRRQADYGRLLSAIVLED